jgi:hypothetical protein
MDKKSNVNSNVNPTGEIAVIADEKNLFLIMREFIQILKDKIVDANVTQQGAVVKFGTNLNEQPLVTVINDTDTVSYEENHPHSDTYRVPVFRVDLSMFSFADAADGAGGAAKRLDNAVEHVIGGAARLLRTAAIDLAAGWKAAMADATHEQQEQEQEQEHSSDQKPELSREEAEYIVNIIKDFSEHYKNYKKGGKKRSSSNILKTSSSRRGRRSSKKRATKRKPKRRQRRASRRAY